MSRSVSEPPSLIFLYFIHTLRKTTAYGEVVYISYFHTFFPWTHVAEIW
jgi:hypothetical protein